MINVALPTAGARSTLLGSRNALLLITTSAMKHGYRKFTATESKLESASCFSFPSIRSAAPHASTTKTGTTAASKVKYAVFNRAQAAMRARR